MNILFLLNYNPYVESGATGNRFCGLVDGICREGHRVTVGVTGGLIKKGEDIVRLSQPNLDIVYLSKANHYNGILGRLNTYFFGGFHLLVAKLRLNRLMKQQFDLVWLTHNYNVLKLFQNRFKGFSGKSFIELNEFNDIYKGETQGNFLQKRKAQRDNQVFMEAVGKIDLFAVMTKTLASHYQSMANPDARFLHLPMTVDLSRFDNIQVVEGTYQKPYIAFTGTMNNQKDGVDVLIKAFAKIANQYPNAHLYLAGFWHYDVPMQDALIAEFGLQGRIHRVGVLNRDQIPPFVGNANLLVLSRPDSHQAQGGFPTKLGEYLATGNPVCVTKVGEIPDYLEDNVSAFMAEPSNVDSFADAMDRALKDVDKAKRVGVNGRKVAEQHFSAEVQAKRLVKFLESNMQ
jgi:glycosyltransferase involved in cell wall biosynthesis